MSNNLNELSDEQLEQVALGKLTIAEALSKKPYYTADNIDELSDEQLQMVANGTPLSEIQKERNEFVGMGSSIAGALGGAAIGSAVPVIGTVVGGIIGGALGAFGGELAEDQLQGEDLNYANAAMEAAISVGIDAATLGTAKWAKPVYFEGKRALGFTVKEVAEDMVQKAVVSKGIQKAGTPASYASTQELLSTTGATLTGKQFDEQGVLSFYESLSRNGILSSKMYAENAVKVNEAISGAINDLAGRSEAGVLLKDGLGEAVDSVLQEAKKALGNQYKLGFDAVMQNVKNDMVDVSSIHKGLDSFLDTNTLKVLDDLDKDVLKLVHKLKKSLSNGLPKKENIIKDVEVSYKGLFGESLTRTEKQVVGVKEIPRPIPAAELIGWQKSVSRLIAKMGDKEHKYYAGADSAERAQISTLLKDSIELAIGKVNPAASAEYAKVRDLFKKGSKVLKPESIKSIINSASKGDYKRLGTIFMSEGGTNFSQFKNTWKATRFAVKSMSPEKVASLGFKDKADMLQTLKGSYVRNMFPDVNATGFDIAQYAKKMSNMSPEEVKKAKLIFGKDYGRFNTIRNAIIEASKTGKSDIGILSLRAKELSSIAAIGGIGYASGGDAGAIGATGLAVLFSPKLMAKIVLNPKQNATLINLLGRRSTTPEGLTATQKAMTTLIAAETVDTSIDNM